MSGLWETLGPLSPILSPTSVLQRSSVRGVRDSQQSRKALGEMSSAFLVFTVGPSSLDGFEINSWSWRYHGQIKYSLRDKHGEYLLSPKAAHWSFGSSPTILISYFFLCAAAYLGQETMALGSDLGGARPEEGGVLTWVLAMQSQQEVSLMEEKVFFPHLISHLNMVSFSLNPNRSWDSTWYILVLSK